MNAGWDRNNKGYWDHKNHCAFPGWLENLWGIGRKPSWPAMGTMMTQERFPHIGNATNSDSTSGWLWNSESLSLGEEGQEQWGPSSRLLACHVVSLYLQAGYRYRGLDQTVGMELGESHPMYGKVHVRCRGYSQDMSALTSRCLMCTTHAAPWGSWWDCFLLWFFVSQGGMRGSQV